MKKDETVRYWVNSSKVDFKAMDNLFSNGHYVGFIYRSFGVGKAVKAYYVKKNDTNVPRIHDLLKIA